VAGEKGRILVVDDNAYIVEGLTEILKRKGYSPISCRGGEEALQLLRSTEVDVMLLDISMQPLDGWKTLERVRTDPSIADTPTIIFSARKFLENEAGNCQWHVDAVLSKPVNTGDLIDAIEHAIGRKRNSSCAPVDEEMYQPGPWPGDIAALVGDPTREQE
jgi:two-component system OmpR family response regulator